MTKNNYVKAETTQTNYIANSIIDWTKSNNLSDGDYNVTVTGEDGTTITYPL